VDQAKAADVASQLVLAGYYPVVELLGSGQYQVSASLDSGIDIKLGDQFIQQNGIAGTAKTMNFI
jgi:hypothetical protein